MMMTLKSKIAMGVLAAGLTTGAGVSLAQTTAGEQLTIWYEAKRDLAFQAVADALGEQSGIQIPAWEAATLTSIGTSLGDLADLFTTYQAGLTSIDDTTKAYTEDIEETTYGEDGILANMDEEFDAEVTELNGATDAAVADLAQTLNLTADLTIPAFGDGAVASLESQAAAIEAGSLTELTTAINQAQTDIDEAINEPEKGEKDRAIKETIDHLEDEIEENKEQIDSKIEQYTTTATTNITNTGNQLTTDLQAQLDDLVADIVTP